MLLDDVAKGIYIACSCISEVAVKCDADGCMYVMLLCFMSVLVVRRMLNGMNGMKFCILVSICNNIHRSVDVNLLK